MYANAKRGRGGMKEVEWDQRESGTSKYLGNDALRNLEFETNFDLK